MKSTAAQTGIRLTKQLSQLALKCGNASETKIREAYHAKLKTKITELRELAENFSGRSYLREKIRDVERGITAIAGLHDGNELPADQHRAFVRQACNTLRNCFENEQPKATHADVRIDNLSNS